ncbi:MAG: TIGR00289 family protein [Candidatus Marsarchaeota archaeon]|jgi:ABC transporter with metal-binding/Fe-S-binding domain ATP-binding protein|nr:TIGR00289 family protein [Candidatus Marsarchaeota archaeon]
MVNACLYSGGKDSTLALHKATELGVNIELLITMRSTNKESYMFHHPNIEFTTLQAEAMGIKHVFANTDGVKEDELKDLERAFMDNDVSLIVTGATYSEYQFGRIGKITDKLGIENMAPLWHIDPITELDEIASRFEAIVTSVSAEGMDESFLGSRIDKEMIEKLKMLNRKYGINMLFEGGEAESFVLDGPLFKKKIEILKARKEWDRIRGSYIIEEAHLLSK